MEQLRYSGYVRAWRRIVEQAVIGKPVFVEGEYFSCKSGDVLFQDDSGVYYTHKQAARYPERKPKMWVEDWEMGALLSVEWSAARHDDPPEIAGHGGEADHGGCDYYAFAAFADAVLHGEPLEMDVYAAVETAAPAIASIEQGSAPQEVPDFRPGVHRKPGELPVGVNV